MGKQDSLSDDLFSTSSIYETSPRHVRREGFHILLVTQGGFKRTTCYMYDIRHRGRLEFGSMGVDYVQSNQDLYYSRSRFHQYDLDPFQSSNHKRVWVDERQTVVDGLRSAKDAFTWLSQI